MIFVFGGRGGDGRMREVASRPRKKRGAGKERCFVRWLSWFKRRKRDFVVSLRRVMSL